jgi:hypothetical protein
MRDLLRISIHCMISLQSFQFEDAVRVRRSHHLQKRKNL